MSDEEWPDDDNGDEDGWGDDAEGDENAEASPEIEIENNFFEAEGNMKDDPTSALEQLKKCV